ncbi:D-alanyl-D-alanine dipeptidase [Azotobacter beijerinckii]|uniref:D-alanyl-D-alanine dipeptidase n=1 Tax=Azotobacter beijerinckii TaxID=170623 RepID=A0A1H6UMN0_9GAMM|nr:M15 family metallopeptidase [Azotobacter beijerinckii]SEI93559.1 D-alanyl-D-alanine dipeptidase [Azotobacter beijerinckii]
MNEPNRAIPAFAEPDWAQVARIPVADCGEALSSLRLAPALRVYPAYRHLGIPEAVDDCQVRQEVFERLLRAAEYLPAGLVLVVLDGWRPIAVQQHLYRTLEAAMARHHPQADAATLQRLTRQFVSPPSTDPQAPSPHLTGGAVDVTLCDAQGRWLDMGSRFDEVGPRSFSAHYETAAAGDGVALAIRDRRRLLHNAMLEAGFSNLPSEWWHYDYGDQLWAWYRGQPAALYGPTAPPSLEGLWQQQLAERFASPT